MAQAFAFFHLNLAYSSLAESQHMEVIQRCYSPLLDLVESGIPLGIEASAWTLQQIAELYPDWLARFKTLLTNRRCELIGSGYVQLIGPLVPAEINRWNQELGLSDYEALLGITPDIALVNEMAYSEGLISVYQQAGYRGLILEGNNAQLATGQQQHFPAAVADSEGRTLPVLWSDSILFQKLQRYVHGECSLDEYQEYVFRRFDSSDQPLCIYSNDAEIFGFRPGRFETEAPLHVKDEWQRIQNLLQAMSDAASSLEWLLPGEALVLQARGEAVQVTSAAHPVPVKKQLKYNLARWAASGRNDVALNTACYREYALALQSGMDEARARRLCEHWASDFRTHIEAGRWSDIEQVLISPSFLPARESRGVSKMDPRLRGDDFGENNTIRYSYSHDGMVLDVATADLQLSLNLHRGLSIRELSFRQHQFKPLVGTQLHGYFDCISLGADFYSGNFVADYTDPPSRVTDLEPVKPELRWHDDAFSVLTTIHTSQGLIHKEIHIPARGQSVRIGIDASALARRAGRSRIAALTLLTQNVSGPYWYETVNGGFSVERFTMTENFDHGQSVSPLVSCTSGVGATEGWVNVGGLSAGIKISWDPAQCAVFPMLAYTASNPSPYIRLILSLQETDDTFREGSTLLPLYFSIQPVDGNKGD